MKWYGVINSDGMFSMQLNRIEIQSNNWTKDGIYIENIMSMRKYRKELRKLKFQSQACTVTGTDGYVPNKHISRLWNVFLRHSNEYGWNCSSHSQNRFHLIAKKLLSE